MKKKQLISLLLALCLTFSLLPGTALAATPNVLSIKLTMTTPEVGSPCPPLPRRPKPPVTRSPTFRGAASWMKTATWPMTRSTLPSSPYR